MRRFLSAKIPGVSLEILTSLLRLFLPESSRPGIGERVSNGGIQRRRGGREGVVGGAYF